MSQIVIFKRSSESEKPEIEIRAMKNHAAAHTGFQRVTGLENGFSIRDFRV
ncbi:hypothetical protein [Burkholderia gladioli]|uniref:hypothetical protein n=1 Tax=Burkholderia gladioli TaxID=28095 RepID=UPI00163F011A|nr:hypothetical protein [Burkholderia gladioli]